MFSSRHSGNKQKLVPTLDSQHHSKTRSQDKLDKRSRTLWKPHVLNGFAINKSQLNTLDIVDPLEIVKERVSTKIVNVSPREYLQLLIVKKTNQLTPQTRKGSYMELIKNSSNHQRQKLISSNQQSMRPSCQSQQSVYENQSRSPGLNGKPDDLTQLMKQVINQSLSPKDQRLPLQLPVPEIKLTISQILKKQQKTKRISNNVLHFNTNDLQKVSREIRLTQSGHLKSLNGNFYHQNNIRSMKPIFRSQKSEEISQKELMMSCDQLSRIEYRKDTLPQQLSPSDTSRLTLKLDNYNASTTYTKYSVSPKSDNLRLFDYLGCLDTLME